MYLLGIVHVDIFFLQTWSNLKQFDLTRLSGLKTLMEGATDKG